MYILLFPESCFLCSLGCVCVKETLKIKATRHHGEDKQRSIEPPQAQQAQPWASLTRLVDFRSTLILAPGVLQVLRLARSLPALHIDTSVQPVTRGILRMTLTVSADFMWQVGIQACAMRTASRMVEWL